MNTHPRSKLGPAGRFALTEAIANGMSQKATAAAFCVAPATAHRWWHRRLGANEQELSSRSWLFDRSSRPRRMRGCSMSSCRSASATAAARRAGGHGSSPAPPGQAHSTVSKVLTRHGISRPERAPKDPANRYERPCPGDLLYMDVSRYCASSAPATPSPAIAPRTRGAGWTPTPASAPTTPTRSSTITPDSPTSSCTPTKRRRP